MAIGPALEMNGNALFNPTIARFQLFIPIPIPAAGFSQFYSHCLPNPISYFHSLALPLTY